MTLIAVYAEWDGLDAPLRLGRLHARKGAGREVFEFEFDDQALAHPATTNLLLDPRLGLYAGRQHPAQAHTIFGAFSDASSDRWGRLLMQRRLERRKRAGEVAANARLYESDYLLGVHDAFRVGALRLRLDDQGDFLDNQHGMAASPFVQLRELEAASLALERDEENMAAAGNDWLRMLIAPGGSLGGARPKASVVDPNGHLWIAKFPSVRDEHDVGAWELVVQSLARACGLRVPESLARRFANPHHSFGEAL
ncbi:MAG: HipA domain-containing protein [Aquabacterium sp.]